MTFPLWFLEIDAIAVENKWKYNKNKISWHLNKSGKTEKVSNFIFPKILLSA